jgi:hypothetical protein
MHQNGPWEEVPDQEPLEIRPQTLRDDIRSIAIKKQLTNIACPFPLQHAYTTYIQRIITITITYIRIREISPSYSPKLPFPQT